MVGSGLRIFNAYPALREGRDVLLLSFRAQGDSGVVDVRRLAWRRRALALRDDVLFVNGLVYLTFIYLHGEWRDLVPRKGDIRDSWRMVKSTRSARITRTREAQRAAETAYFLLPVFRALAVVTGIAIWKPVELAPLTAVFGGTCGRAIGTS
jgi:thiosulfate reductase cytochrome b subunit